MFQWSHTEGTPILALEISAKKSVKDTSEKAVQMIDFLIESCVELRLKLWTKEIFA